MIGYFYRIHNCPTWFFLPFSTEVNWAYLRAVIISYDERPQLRFTCSSRTLRLEYFAQIGAVWDKSLLSLDDDDPIPLQTRLVVAVDASRFIPLGEHFTYAVTEEERFLEQVVLRHMRTGLLHLWSHPDALLEIINSPYFNRASLRGLRSLPSTESGYWKHLRRLHPRLVAHWLVMDDLENNLEFWTAVAEISKNIDDQIWAAVDELLESEIS